MIRLISVMFVCLGLALGVSACGKNGEPKFSATPMVADNGVAA